MTGFDLIDNVQRITSVEIAELTGKLHKDVLRAVRSMEPAWVKTTGRNFTLSEYKDSTGRTLPCYSLSKTECLYIATKFNDEARAKLVLRWAELEEQEQMRVRQQMAEQQESLAYLNNVIESHGTMTSTEIAKELHMSARRMHSMLHRLGIIFKQSGLWFVYARFDDKDLVDYETQLTSEKTGRRYTSRRMRWTEKGHQFVHQIIDAHIRIEQKPRYIETFIIFPDLKNSIQL